MDAPQIATILAILMAFFGIIKYFNSRENLLWKEISKLRESIADIRENYNGKFATVNTNISNMELRVLKSIAESQENVRASHHNATEAITKTLNSFEITVAILSEKVNALLKNSES